MLGLNVMLPQEFTAVHEATPEEHVIFMAPGIPGKLHCTVCPADGAKHALVPGMGDGAGGGGGGGAPSCGGGGGAPSCGGGGGTTSGGAGGAADT
jgi:hypothetical protein